MFSVLSTVGGTIAARDLAAPDAFLPASSTVASASRDDTVVAEPPIKVLVLTRYSRIGATSRIRFHKMIEAFDASERSRLRFTVSPLLGDEYLETLYSEGRRKPAYLVKRYLARALELLSIRDFDCVWIEKEIFPGAPALVERLLARLGIRTVVDFDDATFLYYERNSNPLIRRLFGRKIDHVFSAASVVTVGNKFLAERARQGGASTVVVLPSVVDMPRYADAARTAARRDNQNRRLTIGWIGTPSNARYLHLYGGAIANAQARHDARFVTIGAPSGTLPGVQQDALTWSEATEADHLAAWDIAVAPLEQGLWEIGKCGYKVLQCMAAGLPVIASPVGVIADIVEHGVNGFLAETSAECTSIIEALASDPARRRQIGDAARQTIESRYSVAAWQTELEQAFALALTPATPAQIPAEPARPWPATLAPPIRPTI